jgi:chitodextrinase
MQYVAPVRRTAVVLLVAFGAALLGAAQADAYRLQNHRWYSRTLTYYDATGVYRSEVRAAARQWNRSGARIRIRAASRRSARVLIRVDPRLGARRAGVARYTVFGGIVSRATIGIRPNFGNDRRSSAEARAARIAVFAHELGHVLGLAHETRRCALMNTRLWTRCKAPPEAYRYRCRILEADDIRGVIRRFGGRVRSRGPAYCFAESAPAAPAVSVETADPERGVLRVSWTMPAGNVGRVRVLRRAGACPTAFNDPAAVVVADFATSAGAAHSGGDAVTAAGTYCYAAVAFGALGRPGALATASHAYLGRPPVADFDGEFTAQRTVVFTDGSADSDGQVVAWSWNFADGTTSTERNPTHTFTAAGTYNVTLTVTDNTGQTDSHTRPVVVS